MGTQLISHGIKLPLPLWSAQANIEEPQIVQSIHKDYVEVGADIITTNTFRTTTWSYRRAEYSPKRASRKAKDSLMKAIDLARSVNPNILAGSITSINDCYEPDKFPGKTIAEDSYGETVEWFIEGGVDTVLLETMGHLDEINIALEATKNISTVWLSLIINEKGHLLSGDSLREIYALNIKQLTCLMLNCNTIELTGQSLNSFVDNSTLNWGIYPNLGLTQPEIDGEIHGIVDTEKFKQSIISYLDKKPYIIGACCGSTPNHIKIIQNLIEEKTIY